MPPTYRKSLQSPSCVVTLGTALLLLYVSTFCKSALASEQALTIEEMSHDVAAVWKDSTTTGIPKVSKFSKIKWYADGVEAKNVLLFQQLLYQSADPFVQIAALRGLESTDLSIFMKSSYYFLFTWDWHNTGATPLFWILDELKTIKDTKGLTETFCEVARMYPKNWQSWEIGLTILSNSEKEKLLDADALTAMGPDYVALLCDSLINGDKIGDQTKSAASEKLESLNGVPGWPIVVYIANANSDMPSMSEELKKVLLSKEHTAHMLQRLYLGRKDQFVAEFTKIRPNIESARQLEIDEIIKKEGHLSPKE